MTCPKWHFGQVGQGAKKTTWGFLLPKFLVKKTMIFYSGSKSRSQNKKNKNKNMTCVKQKSNKILSQK